MSGLVEIDSLEAIVIIDNELDLMSWIQPDTVQVSRQWKDLALGQPELAQARGVATKELLMESLCCGAHGLSVLLTATKGDVKHSVLFDAGPEEEAWERNVKRLAPKLSSIEVIHLSHWHRDHSGGMLKAIRMIHDAKKKDPSSPGGLVVDVHPERPDYRGFQFPGQTKPISLQADPTFAEMEAAGAKIEKSSTPHTILDNMFLISGEIPRLTPYEPGLRGGVRFFESTKKWEKDEAIADERLLMCNLKGKGIVVLTGCSHAGVINASKHAVELLQGRVPLYAVLGGFHLVVGNKTQVEDTVKDFKALNPKVLLPGHCSGWRVKYEIEKEMPGSLVPCTVGSQYSF